MKWARNNTELLAWVTALLVPFLIDPSATHFSFCLFHLAGLDWCPGCGLGRSIAWLYRGEWSQSFQTHWFGIPGVLFLMHRIIVLLRIQLTLKPKPTTT